MEKQITEREIPGKDEISAILGRSLFEMYQLGLDIKHVEITVHCGSGGTAGEKKEIVHIEDELDTPVCNSITYLMRRRLGVLS